MGSAYAMQQSAEIVKFYIKRNPVVVVSAVGKDIDDGNSEKVTDMLIYCHKKAEDAKLVKTKLDEIAERHYTLMKSLNLDYATIDSELTDLGNSLDSYRGHLISRTANREAAVRLQNNKESLLDGLDDIDEVVRKRFSAEIQSYGERLSAKIFASYLSQRFDAQAYNAFDIGMITDSEFEAAKPLNEAFSMLKKNIAKMRCVPVITGYIGKDIRGSGTLLIGRGGSDYSAAVIANAITAKELLIYSDADGIMTADPKIIKTARTIPELSFEEAAELTYFGAKILHPSSVVPAIRKNITVKVLNTFNPSGSGTTITKRHSKGNAIKGIANKEVYILTVKNPEMVGERGFAEKIFSISEQYGISVETIGTSSIEISYTFEKNGISDLADLITALQNVGEVSRSEGTSINVVGDALKSTPGMMGDICSILGDNKINIMMPVCANGSALNLLINRRNGKKALRVLHEELIEKKN